MVTEIAGPVMEEPLIVNKMTITLIPTTVLPLSHKTDFQKLLNLSVRSVRTINRKRIIKIIIKIIIINNLKKKKKEKTEKQL